MTKTIKFVTISLFLIFFLCFPIDIVNAHQEENHKTRTVYVCQGRQISVFRAFFMRIFQRKSFQQCTFRQIEIHPDNNVTPSPTNNHSDNPTNVPTPTYLPTTNPTVSPPTVSPPTVGPTKIPTIPPVSNSGGQPNQYWHEPKSHDSLNGHEHGDKPPTWADEFSQKNFGHNVMFGGDEATPNENILKHQAYKGFLMKVSGVDVFIRYHSMSVPTDRIGPLHSYEVYAKDGSGNVSFWQGWMFHGYPNIPSQRMPRHGEQAGYDPLHGTTWPGRDQFIIAGADEHDWKDYKRCEQWYGHGGLWSWDISITICGATTFFTPNEHLSDVYNQSLWKLTGALGGNRRLEVSHYGPNNPLVGGENLPFNKWFCVKKLPNEDKVNGRTPLWNITDAVSGPNSCQDGWLPQFVTDTFPKKGVYFETGNTAEKDFPTTGVSVPN